MVNDAKKKASRVDRQVERPGPGAGVERDTATEFQKPLRTLNAF